NALLPASVRVRDVREAPAGFSARRSALGKRYAYLIDRGPWADPFLRRYAWHLPHALDADAMAAALRLIRGKHDFSAFCAAAGPEGAGGGPEPGDRQEKGFRGRKREDHALALIDELRGNLDDVARVKRILLELGRFYDPVLGGAVVGLSEQKAIVEALGRGD